MQPTPATFYIVRHGETEWNTKKLVQGHGDSPLTTNGEQQVAERAKDFASIHFDHVFSSDLMRAQRTVEILAIDKKLAVNTTRLLRERSFGKYEGKRYEIFDEENKKLIEQRGILSEEEKSKFKFADDIESDAEVIGHLLTFLRETAVTYEGKTMLVVTHGGVLRLLLRHLGRHDLDHGKIHNLAYIVLKSDGIDFDIKELHGITPPEK